MERKTLKATLALIELWLHEGWKQINADIKAGHVRQDYVTASDLVSYVRLQADRATGEEHWQITNDQAPWWGYKGWTRIVITDKPSGWTLLGYVQNWLYKQAAAGVIEGHNFGRGHVSRARYRPKGSGLPEREQKTIEQRQKPKPVHARRSGGYRPLCTANRPKSFRSRQFTGVRTTTDPAEVTCPRCRKLLERIEKNSG